MTSSRFVVFSADDEIRPDCASSATLLLPSILFAQSQPTASQQASTKGMKLDTGEEIFKAACIGCHGPDGTGQPETILGFEPPPAFPDFTDCNGSTRERTADWSAIIHEGGPVRGFSEIMPSWKEALTDEQINKVIGFLRTRCEEPGWPLGELNLPRALFTEKAFPEDEWVLTTTVNTNGSGEVAGALIYEKRLGRRNQLEFAAPYAFLQDADKGWDGGIGDLVLGYKRVLFTHGHEHDPERARRSQRSNGKQERRGLGSGVTTFETVRIAWPESSAIDFLSNSNGFRTANR